MKKITRRFSTWSSALVLAAVASTPGAKLLADPPPGPPESEQQIDKADADRPSRWDEETLRKRHNPENRPGPLMRMLTDEQFEEIITILNDVSPQRAEELKKIREANPEKAAELVRENMGRLGELAFLKRRAPEIYKVRVADYRLNRESENLAREYRAAVDAKDEAKAKELHDQLLAKLKEQFKVRQQMRQLEVARLEKQLADTKARLEATAAAEDSLIQDRLNDLTSKGTKPEW